MNEITVNGIEYVRKTLVPEGTEGGEMKYGTIREGLD